jgi:hypothetical protein
MAFRMHYGSFGLIGYTMKIIRGAARLANSQPRREITLETLAQSYAVNVWAERLDGPNPFLVDFDPDKAPPVKIPSRATTGVFRIHGRRNATRVELHA